MYNKYSRLTEIHRQQDCPPNLVQPKAHGQTDRKKGKQDEELDEQLTGWHITDSPHGVRGRSAKLADSKPSLTS
jgi:hypothetical protein